MPEIDRRLTTPKTVAPTATATIAARDCDVPPPRASTASIPTAAASVIELTLKKVLTQPRRVTAPPKAKPSATAMTTAGAGSSSASATMYASSCVVVSPVAPPRTSRVPKRCSSPINAATARTSAGRSTNGRPATAKSSAEAATASSAVSRDVETNG